MTDPVSLTEEEASNAGTVAIQTAANAATAQENARTTDTAALLAKVDEKLTSYNEQNKNFMKDTIVDVLENVFGKEQSTYVVKNRVPLFAKLL